MTTKFYEPGEQRSVKVHALFGQIAHRYDLVNDLQSLGLHRKWKRRTAELAAVKLGQKALDICCGTGDISMALAGCGAEVVGLDFTAEMLSLAEQRYEAEVRGQRAEGKARIWFIRGDAERLPFRDDSFDAVTVGYGLRNVREWRSGIQEMQRVARPGGRLVVLEFGKPENPVWRWACFSYLRLLVPLFGFLFYGNAGAYRYILESLNHYPSQLQVAKAMRDLGLVNVRVHNLIGGAMSIQYAEKAGACQL